MNAPLTEFVSTTEASTAYPAFPPSNVAELLARVKERGYVTTGEVFAAAPDLEPAALPDDL